MKKAETLRMAKELKEAVKKETGLKVSINWALARLYLMGLIPSPPSCMRSTESRNSRGQAVVGEICPTGWTEIVG